MACRPPPPFEVQDLSVIASIAFDQTYAKAGGTTGMSSGLNLVLEWIGGVTVE